MTAGRLILDDGEPTHHRRGEGPPAVPLHGGSSPVAGPRAHHEDPRCLLDRFDRALPRLLSASR